MNWFSHICRRHCFHLSVCTLCILEASRSDHFIPSGIPRLFFKLDKINKIAQHSRTITTHFEIHPYPKFRDWIIENAKNFKLFNFKSMFRSDSMFLTALGNNISLFSWEARNNIKQKISKPFLNAALFYPSMISGSSDQGSKSSYFRLIQDMNTCGRG